MPILLHECSACKRELTDLYQPRDPKPYCCGRAMRLLMPTRVVGRVVPDSNGAHAGSGFASSPSSDAMRFALADGGEAVQCGDAVYEGRPESRLVSSPVDPDDERNIPLAPSTGAFAKDYEDCSADERDARWHDSAQALSAWTATQLEKTGENPTAAREKAADAAQQTITKARAESTRADGLT